MSTLKTPRGDFEIYEGTWKDFNNEADRDDWGLWFEHFLPEDASSMAEVTDYYKIFHNHRDNSAIAVLYKSFREGINERLIQSSSEDAFKKNVETEIKAGKPPKQAVAIAHSVKRKNESVEGEEKLMETRGVNRVRTLSVSDGRRLHIDKYPNFSATGSITGMRKQFYGENALLVRCGGYIYNVPPEIYYQAH